MPRKVTPEVAEEMQKMREHGFVLKEIGEYFDLSPTTVIKYTTRVEKIHVKNLRTFGMDARRKLSEEDVEEIKRLYTTGRYSTADIARMYRVAPATVHYHVNSEYKTRTNNRSKAHHFEYISAELAAKRARESTKKKAELLNSLRDKQRTQYLNRED